MEKIINRHLLQHTIDQEIETAKRIVNLNTRLLSLIKNKNNDNTETEKVIKHNQVTNEIHSKFRSL